VPAFAVLLIVASSCLAQTGPVSKTNPDVTANAGAYWTPERFKAARPFPLPQVVLGATPKNEDSEGTHGGRMESSDGAPPSQHFLSTGQQLFTPDPKRDSTERDEPIPETSEEP
jgi:hypothetical protein